MFRPKPLIKLKVTGPTGSTDWNMLVDTGSDDVVFPQDVAAIIGVDLGNAAQRHARGVGASTPTSLLYAPTILELRDGQQSCRWRSIVAFAKARLQFGLFGIAGGLEHFRFTLDVMAREIILDLQPSIPATSAAIP